MSGSGREGPRSPGDFDWQVRTEIYRSFGETGRAPAIGEIAARVGSTEHAVTTSLWTLFAAHEIAPRSDGAGVWMANPFSAVPTPYRVETPDFVCYANCAWDALGIPAILGRDGWTRTRCAHSDAPLEFGIVDGTLRGDDGVIHLLTPLRHAWDDIGFT